MVGHQLGPVAGSVRGKLLQPGRRSLVPLSPGGSWQLTVGDVPHQHMPEGDLDLPGDPGSAHSPQELLLFQGGQVLSVRVSQESLDSMRRALSDGSSARWHELKTVDSDIAIDLVSEGLRKRGP